MYAANSQVLCTEHDQHGNLEITVQGDKQDLTETTVSWRDGKHPWEQNDGRVCCAPKTCWEEEEPPVGYDNNRSEESQNTWMKMKERSRGDVIVEAEPSHLEQSHRTGRAQTMEITFWTLHSDKSRFFCLSS